MSLSKEEKLKKLKEGLKTLEKAYGENSVSTLSEKPSLKLDVVSTHSLTLDLATGVGGLPKGRIVEIYGPESSGKTTICTHVIAEAQKNNGVCLFIDAEHAFDKDYAVKLGVNVEELYFFQPKSGEEALNYAIDMIKLGIFDVVVIDSVAALTPQSEIEGDVGENKIGLQARMMSQALRKLASVVSITNTLLIFTNQLREKIGVMYGSPEITSGGNALKFFASIRLDVRKRQRLENNNGEIEGNITEVKVVKNKVGAPLKIAKFEIIYNEGISQMKEVIDLAVELDIIKKAGSWYSYGDIKIGQGENSVKSILSDNQEMYEEIKDKIIAKINYNGIEIVNTVTGTD